MQLSFKFNIFLVRFFRRSKTTYTKSLPVGHYLRAPFTLMGRYAQQLAFISFGCSSYILKIFKSGCFPQISKTIVTFIPIYMVKVCFRPFSRHIKPSQSVRQPFFVEHRNGNVPVGACTPRKTTNKILPGFSLQPNKYARSGGVFQNPLNILLRDIGIVLHNWVPFWVTTFYHSEFPE